MGLEISFRFFVLKVKMLFDRLLTQSFSDTPERDGINSKVLELIDTQSLHKFEDFVYYLVPTLTSVTLYKIKMVVVD